MSRRRPSSTRSRRSCSGAWPSCAVRSAPSGTSPRGSRVSSPGSATRSTAAERRWRGDAVTLPVFHADRSLFLGGSAVTLDGPEGHHAAAVRRLSSGERLLLTDGAGALAECLVREAARDAVLGGGVRAWAGPAPSPRLAVGPALPKGGR